MRSMWSGSISFGLVNIPVKLYSATRESTIDFDLLHKEDLSPIRYRKVCEREGKEVPNEEIVRGYEYRKDEYVIISDEDFQKVSPKRNRMIEISEFVSEDEVNPIYFEKPYYLEPDKGADKPYALLREALRESGKVAVATFILRSRERLGIVKVIRDILVLAQIRFDADIVKPEGLRIPEAAIAGEGEIDLALTLIQHLTKTFKPEDYRNTYNEELMGLIEAKAEGRVPVSRGEEPMPTKIVDLMEVLKASLEKVDKTAA